MVFYRVSFTSLLTIDIMLQSQKIFFLVIVFHEKSIPNWNHTLYYKLNLLHKNHVFRKCINIIWNSYKILCMLQNLYNKIRKHNPRHSIWFFPMYCIHPYCHIWKWIDRFTYQGMLLFKGGLTQYNSMILATDEQLYRISYIYNTFII
jgi:hypothetical protein